MKLCDAIEENLTIKYSYSAIHYEWYDTEDPVYSERLSSLQVAKILGIHHGTVRKAASEGRIKRTSDRKYTLNMVANYILSRRRKWTKKELRRIKKGKPVYRSPAAVKTMKSRMRNERAN